MAQDFSWERAANAYEELYQKAGELRREGEA
jgi:glycogen synthase